MRRRTNACKTPNSKKIWITWEIQRRNQTTSKELGFTLFEIIYIGNSFLRYIFSIFKTVKIIYNEKPDIVAVQNPSLVLTIEALLLSKALRFMLIVDSHNAGIKPFEGKVWWANWLANAAIRNAKLTIVTNEVLAEYVTSRGGNTAILPDPIPEIDCGSFYEKSEVPRDFNVICISSWAEDEPYLEVIEASKKIPRNIKIKITGMSKGKEKSFKGDLPNNVILTGFLPNQDYLRLLCNSDLCMVLTTRDDCMVCGAYESIAAGKPLILSNTPVLNSYFGGYAQFVSNVADSIAEKIIEIYKSDLDESDRLIESRSRIENNWRTLRKHVEAKLLTMTYSGK